MKQHPILSIGARRAMKALRSGSAIIKQVTDNGAIYNIDGLKPIPEPAVHALDELGLIEGGGALIDGNPQCYVAGACEIDFPSFARVAFRGPWIKGSRRTKAAKAAIEDGMTVVSQSALDHCKKAYADISGQAFNA